MGKTILFGPSGFLGPSILKKFPRIIAVGRTKPPLYCKNKFIKIKNLNNLRILDKVQIDHVIFLVGNSNHYKLNKQNIDVALSYNFYPLKETLDYFSKRKIKKFISFSGALVYDEKNLKLPCNETAPLNPFKNNYIFSKYLTEQLTKAYSNMIPIINVRLSNIYGPSHLEREDLIISLFNQALKKNIIKVNSMEPKRDFIHLDDIANAIILLCKSNYTGNINIGSGKCTSVKKVCKIIEQVTSKKVQNLNKQVSGPLKYYHDISLIKKITGWKPKIGLEKGLETSWKKTKYLISHKF